MTDTKTLRMTLDADDWDVLVESVTKHLAGRHDQSTHGHGHSSSHASHVTSDYGDKIALKRVNPPTLADTHNDYEMQHQAASNNGFSVNILNLDEHMPDVSDPTKGPRYYGTNTQSDKESFNAFYSLTGDPNQKVTIYRGVPTSVDAINNGDWVTLSPTYAATHVASNLNGEGHVLATEVPASALWSDGDSINEFGVDFSTEVHKHLAGQHDQSTHGHGHSGKPSKIDPRKWAVEVALNSDALWQSDKDQIAHHRYQRDAGFSKDSTTLDPEDLKRYNNAVDAYTHQLRYVGIQNGLRNDKPSPSAKNLEELIDKAPPIPHDLFTYRGVAAGEVADKLKSLPVGSILQDKGFFSVTTDYGVASSFEHQIGTTGMSDYSSRGGITMRVLVPKGTKGLDVLGWNYKVDKDFIQNKELGEQEFIMKPNTKFEVLEDGEFMTVIVRND